MLYFSQGLESYALDGLTFFSPFYFKPKGSFMNTKNLVTEFVGTFALIFIGAGALAIGQANLVGVALAHGLVHRDVCLCVWAYLRHTYQSGCDARFADSG